MKKTLGSVVRLAMFVGVLVLLLFKGKGLEAQLAHQCVVFFTEDGSCPNCCTTTSGNFPNEIITVDLPTGTQSILVTNWSCGTASKGGCSVACSGTYNQAVSDSGCCIASGSKCATNEPCCPGLICLSSGSCGACSAQGGSCGSTSDCCSATNVCTAGKCVNPACSETCKPGFYRDPITCFCVPDSPIVLDVSGSGFNLTNAANGVSFDMSGTGLMLQMGWTARGADNAFLALPGPDGLVHNGQQLFGNFTPQPPSQTPNGFAALAVYDQPTNGGNGDGIIDARDAIFSSLRLWIDANHDGICQPNEMFTLPSQGINSIGLNYKESEKTDQYGNVFRYRARLNPDKTTDAGKTVYDIFFVTID